MVISIEHCRYASDYNWKNRIWDRNADFNVEGVRTLIKITAEQGILKEPLPQPSKYIDHSYLKQALAETRKKVRGERRRGWRRTRERIRMIEEHHMNKINAVGMFDFVT